MSTSRSTLRTKLRKRIVPAPVPSDRTLASDGTMDITGMGFDSATSVEFVPVTNTGSVLSSSVVVTQSADEATLGSLTVTITFGGTEQSSDDWEVFLVSPYGGREFVGTLDIS